MGGSFSKMGLKKEYAPILEALADKRGLDITIMDLSETSSIAEVFILVTSNSNIHIRTLRDAARESLDKMGIPSVVEGDNSTQWCLIDGGYIVIHIFSRQGRDFYRLEKTWGDAPSISYEYQD